MSEDPIVEALVIMWDVIRELTERVQRLENQLETPFGPIEPQSLKAPSE